MLNKGIIVTTAMLFWLVSSPICIAQTKKTLSGRELLKAMRGEDIPTASELIDKYTQALDSTESFIESYETVTNFSYYIPNYRPRMTGAKVYKRGQNRSDGRRKYRQSYKWGDINSRLINLSKDTPSYNLDVYDDKKFYGHTKIVGDASSRGSVVHNYKGVEKAVFSRSMNSSILGFLGSDERLDSVLRQAHQIAVRPRTEAIGGSKCYVIDARTKYGKYTIWLDPEHGYHPVKANRKATEGDEHSTKGVLSTGHLRSEYLKNVRFEKIDGIWIPMEADRGSDNIYGSPESFSKNDTHFKRTKIVLNPDHDKLGSFDNPLENPNNDPELINGTRVEIVINNRPVKYTWQNGKVVDAKGREVDLKALKPKEPVSLVGKQLPESSKKSWPTANELLAKYAETQDKLQSYIIKTDITTEVHKSRFGRITYYNPSELRFDGNRNKLIGRSWGDVPGRDYIPKDRAIYTSVLWDGNMFLQNSLAIGYDPSYDTVMIDKNKDPSNALDMVEMVGACAARGYFYGDAKRVDSILRGADTISVAEKTENIQGVECYVIEAKSKYGKHKLWIDPEHGYNIARAQVHKSENDLITRGKYILKRGESMSTTLDEVRFEKINNIWVPMEGSGINKKTRSGKTPSELKLTFRHSEVKLNPDHEALGSFLPDDVRNGATVFVVGIDNTRYTWQDGKIVDKNGQELGIDALKPKKRNTSRK